MSQSFWGEPPPGEQTWVEQKIVAALEGYAPGGGGGVGWTFVSCETGLTEAGDFAALTVLDPPSAGADFISPTVLLVQSQAIDLTPPYPPPFEDSEGRRTYVASLLEVPPSGTYPLAVYSSIVNSNGQPVQTGPVDVTHSLNVGAPAYDQAEITNTWTLAAAAAQPSTGTGVGKFITSLTYWENRLYAGYGDINGNTGPIEVLALDLLNPGAGFVSEATLHTEATGPYRAFGDRLYQVFQDPKQGIGNPEEGMLAWRSKTDPTWHIVPNTIPYAEHIYDIAVTSNGDHFMCGLAENVDGDSDNHNVVWRSIDDMATWTASYTGPLNPGSPWPYRIYQFGDELFIYDYPANSWQGWDGSAWTVTNPTQGFVQNPYESGPDILKATVTATTQAGNTDGPAEIYINGFGTNGIGLGPNAGPAVIVAQFIDTHRQGAALQQYYGGRPCVSADGERIYVQDLNGAIFSYSTTEPTQTQRLELQLPLSDFHQTWEFQRPMCLAVVDGTIYWGGIDSKVRSAELPGRAQSG